MLNTKKFCTCVDVNKIYEGKDFHKINENSPTLKK